MKTRLLFVGMLAAGLVATATLYATSAQENTTASAMAVAATCEGAFSGNGWLELTPDATDPGSATAIFIDAVGRHHETLGYGVSGETMILIDGRDPITAGIELGAALEADGPATECLIADVQTETRELTLEDVDRYALDGSLAGQTAEIETSISGIFWPAQ